MTDRFEPREETPDVDDYRALFDSSIFRVWHLEGKQRVFRIVRVTRLTSEMFVNGKKQVQTQPKLKLATRDGEIVDLPFLLNKVNARTIAQLYTKRPRAWVGKWIWLYPTTTERQGEIVDCIRVRNEVPGARTRRTNKQGANVLPPGARDSDDAAYMARDNQRAQQEEIGQPPSEPSPLDHRRDQRPNDDNDPGTLEAEYEIVQ